MSSRKEKGKGKAMDPPPPQKKMVDVFGLETKELESSPEVTGSYGKLLTDIRMGISRRTEAEWVKANKSKSMPSLTVHGKLVLPKMEESFVVRVTNSTGESVWLLFSWHNLYNTAFYVEADKCWYHYNDYDESILPPREQFSYHPVRGKGLYALPLGSEYRGVGRKEITLGQVAFDGYVHQLCNIREKSRRVGNHLKMDQPMLAQFRKGPFSFGPVVISEPSRFADYQTFMLRNIWKPITVPALYTQFFTSWGGLCQVIREGKGYISINDSGEEIVLTVEEARIKISVLLSCKD